MVYIPNPKIPTDGAVQKEGFNWVSNIQKTHARKIRRQKTLAITKQNPDFNKAHPQECKQAASNNFTELQLRMKKELKAKLDYELQRREKLRPKN